MVPLSAFASTRGMSGVSGSASASASEPPYPLFPSSLAPPGMKSSKSPRTPHHHQIRDAVKEENSESCVYLKLLLDG